MWTIESAQLTINALREFHHGYFFALAGGVLYRGESFHDLDIACVSISGHDQRGKLLGVAKARMNWDLQSFWNYNSYVTVYKFKDNIGRVIELWVCACEPVSFGPIAKLVKWIKAAARRVRYFVKGYK